MLAAANDCRHCLCISALLLHTCIRIATGFEQGADARSMALASGDMQRCCTSIAAARKVCVAIDEQAEQVILVVGCSPVQRCTTCIAGQHHQISGMTRLHGACAEACLRLDTSVHIETYLQSSSSLGGLQATCL